MIYLCGIALVAFMIVAMPLRAFLLFLQSIYRMKASSTAIVAMPLRAFLLFLHTMAIKARYAQPTINSVAMPLRAFLLFLPGADDADPGSGIVAMPLRAFLLFLL
jgi:hypothetical protein